MPMTRKRAFVEIGKMGAYMSFPLCVYLFANRHFVLSDHIDKKLKKLEEGDTSTPINEIFDVNSSTVNYLIDLTRKIDKFFNPKKD